MTPENARVSFLPPAAERALSSLQEHEDNLCPDGAVSQRRVSSAATQVFESANALRASSHRNTQQSSRDLIANLRKARNQCGVQEQNRTLSPLVAPQLNMDPIVPKALSPIDVLRQKGEGNRPASGRSLSLLDTVERNRRLDEMTEGQIAAGALNAMGDAMVWAAKKVCHVHPSVTGVCRATKNIAVESAKYVVDRIPQEIQKTVVKGIEKRRQNISAEAVRNESVYQIPSETTESYHHNLGEVSVNAVLGWGTGKVISGAGRVLGKVAKPVVGKAAILTSQLVAPVVKQVQTATQVVVNKVENAITVREVTKAAMEVLQREEFSPKIAQLLPEYSADPLAADAFFKKVKDSRFVPITIKDSGDLLDVVAQGLSGGKVFMGVGPNGTIPLVVKSLPLEQLVEEIIANNTYRMLKIPRVYFPRITAVGKQIDKHGQIDGIFEMSSLPGTPLGVMMKEVGLAAPNSPARNVLLENVSKGMDQVAGFLAELHNKSLPFKSSPSPKYISAEIDRIRLLYNVATEDLKLNLTMGKTELEELIHHFKMNPGSGGMTHGDAHLRNFFYHSKGLQSIDHQKLTRSLGAKGAPIGVSIKDYEQMRVAAEVLGRSVGVDAKELELIRGRFETTYWNAFKGVHTPEAIKFYQCFWPLDRLVRGFEEKLLQQEFLNQFNAEWGASSFKSVLKLPPREERRLATIIEKSRQLPALGEEATLSETNIISAVKEISPPSSFDLDHYLFQSASRGRPIEIIPVGRRVDLYAAEHLGYVKKIDEVQKILREVKALSIFKELDLQHSQVPEILGVQIVGDEAQLFTSRLSGAPIRDVLQVMTINHEKHRSQEAVARAHQAFKSLGKALGELHSITVKSKYEIQPARIHAEVVKCRADYKVVKDFAEKHNMELPHHPQSIEWLKEDYYHDPGFAAFVSDDPHFGNFLFDSATSKVSLIDLSAHYVTSQGIPEANPIRYFHRTLTNLESDAMRLGMTSEERRSFVKALRDGYESTFSGGVPKASDRFNRVAAQYEQISDLIKQIPITNIPARVADENEIKALILRLDES